METYTAMVRRERHRARLHPTLLAQPRYTVSCLERGGNFEMKTPGLNAHFLCVPCIPGARLVYRQPKLLQEGMLNDGQITFHPAGRPAHWIAEAPPVVKTVNISLDPALLAECASRPHVDVTPTPWFYDKQVQRLAVIIADETAAGSQEGGLFMDSLIRSLCARLNQRYEVSPAPLLRQHKGRAEVRRVCEILHADLQSDHRMEDLAALTSLSGSQLARLFKAETGQSLYSYLLNLRVERARELLLQSRESIAEIAVSVGFCDQSHLTRHFKRLTGVTPKAMRTK